MPEIWTGVDVRSDAAKVLDVNDQPPMASAASAEGEKVVSART